MAEMTSKPKIISSKSNVRYFQWLLGSLITIVLMILLLWTGVGAKSYRTVIYLLIGIVGIFTAGAVILRPEVGAFILIFSIFTNLSNWLEINGFPSINKPLVALVVVSLIVHFLFRGGRFVKLQSTEILLFGFATVAAMTFMVAQDQEVVLSWTIDFVKDLIILTCIVYALRSSQVWKRAGWILLLSATLLAAMGIYQVVTGNYHHDFLGLATVHYDSSIVGDEMAVRLQGPIDDPNFYGQIMVSILPLAIYRIFRSSKITLKIIGIISSIAISLAIIFSYSRGAFLALLVILILILLERRVDPRAFLSILMAGFLLFSVLPTSYQARISTLLSFTDTNQSPYVQDNSLRGRSSEMQAGILMWQDNPILGVGIDNYPTNYQDYSQRIGLEYRSEVRQAHSLYIQFLAETGIIGISIFTAFLISLFLNLRKAYRKLKLMDLQESFIGWSTAIGIGIVGYLVSSIFLHGDYFRYFILLVALCLSAIHIVRDQRFGQEPNSNNLKAM